MRRIGIAVFLLIGLFSCKKSTEFVINGEVKNPGADNKVYLLLADTLGQMYPVDSAFLNEDNQFKFKATAAQPEFCQLLIGKRSYILIAENGDEIVFKADLNNASGSYEISGSEEAEKITAYNKISSAFSNETGTMAESYSKMITIYPDKKDSIIAEYNNKVQQLTKPFLEKSYQFIKENKNSLSAFFAANVMMGMDATAYENELIAYSKEAKTTFPNNKSIQAFAMQMASLEKVAIGKMAPEITAMSPDGKAISLSNFKGKYVLLDFWASWCGPCRQENPNVVAQYQKFKNKNFTVFGFSLDDDQDKWKKAIQDDNLSWTHVSELKQWDSSAAKLYNVNAIPASFLIDPSGKIVAKNLRGADLAAFLEKVL